MAVLLRTPRHDHCKLVSLLLLVVVVLSLVQAQAPGDYDETCRTGANANAHIFPPEWVLLLDSYDYANLYDQQSPGPVWITRNFDSDSLEWEQTTQGPCLWSSRACVFENIGTPPEQDNWLFTQYISYRDAIYVSFNVSYNFIECVQRPTCTNNYVTVYKYDTDGTVGDAVRGERGNYAPLFGSGVESSRLEQGSDPGEISTTLRFNRPANREGFYLGFQDTATCGMVVRVILYYTVARGRTEELLSCPDVPLPVEGTSTSACSCSNTSSAVGSLDRTCDVNGMCLEDQMCACNPGYEYNATLSTCVACPAGTYKAGVSNDSCQVCPMMSESRDPGSAICDCIPPNSRAGGDGPDVNCRDRRLSTSSAVAITFFVTFIPVTLVAFIVGGLLAYFCRSRIEKII